MSEPRPQALGFEVPQPRRAPDDEPSTCRQLARAMASGEITAVELAAQPGEWSVRCGSQRYTILTRVSGLPPATQVIYAVIDWRRAIVGACDLIGGTWRDGTFSDQDCQLMLAALAGGVISVRREMSERLQILHTTSRSHP